MGGRVSARGVAAKRRSEPAGAKPPRGGVFPDVSAAAALKEILLENEVKALRAVDNLLKSWKIARNSAEWFLKPRESVPVTTNCGPEYPVIRSS